MGGNILRRTALAVLWACAFVTPAELWSDDGPRTPRRNGIFNSARPDALYRIPRQGHAAEKAWSLHSAVFGKPEVQYWLDRWNLPEGRDLFHLSNRRLFEYRSAVQSIIREADLPWEFSAIPVVESHWRVDAVSSSGAVGPWQFMESSARGRELVIDSWRDDRRDVWKSTAAAMKELAFGKRLFSDALLALASYNAGPTRMRKLMKGGGFEDFWEMSEAGVLPAETENYVPRIIAAAYLGAHAGRLGLPLSWEESPEWVLISLDRAIHLETMINRTGMDADQILRAHRELNHPVTPPPAPPYFIKVPKSSEKEVRDWLMTLDEIPGRFHRYSVRRGDTLLGISARFDVPISELRRYNGHVRNDRIYVGERLYIPGDGFPELESLPEWTGRYHVKPGDNLWSIARSLGVTPADLAEANHRSPEGLLLAGSVLRVPEEGK